jgi:hypothetical protein
MALSLAWRNEIRLPMKRCVSQLLPGGEACRISENRPVSRPKQAAEFNLIFSLYPVEIADLSL